jgi:hypothetical protein
MRAALYLLDRIRDPFHSTNAIAGRLAAQIALATTKAQPVPIAEFKGLLLMADKYQNKKKQKTVTNLNVNSHESDGPCSN